MKNILSTLIALLALIITACSNADDLGQINENGSGQVTEAVVTFTYTVPEQLLDYTEITVCYNNDDGTDAMWHPMLDDVCTVTYHIDDFPVTAPVVFVYKPTNRPAHGVNVDWEITMDISVKMIKSGEITFKDYSETYVLSGDLGAELNALQKNALARTYAAKISKNGDLNFVH